MTIKLIVRMISLAVIIIVAAKILYWFKQFILTRIWLQTIMAVVISYNL